MDGAGAATGTVRRGQEVAAGAPVAFPFAGVLRGWRRCLPLMAGLKPDQELREREPKAGGYLSGK